jgi:hypothetical protein
MESKNGADNLNHIQDFTEKSYRKLLSLLNANYSPITFTESPNENSNFVFWRHDVDISLNRAFQLAKIEQESGVKSTYLVDPHSFFYNLAEKPQVLLLRKILDMGHSLGLHFDANFWDVQREEQLADLVDREASWLESLLGARPEALSFHNPSELHLKWRADSYGGLVNCYSQRLMDSVPFISDSNGYWRFMRLFDVISAAEKPCFQVLTHPGWWQEKPMHPRARIFRAAFGRAAASLSEYESTLVSTNRENVDDTPQGIRRLTSVWDPKGELFDYLWNKGLYSSLFLELWIQHESQINRLSRAMFRNEWRIPLSEVNAFFMSGGASLDGWRLFELVFGLSWQSVAGIEPTDHQRWEQIRNQIVHGRVMAPPSELRNGCTYLAAVVDTLAQWGLDQPFKCDGIAPFKGIELSANTIAGNTSDELNDGLTTPSNPKLASPTHQREWEKLQGRLKHLNL